MPDYQPLDVAAFRNCGPERLWEGNPLIGQQSLRGLPFEIGELPHPFIGFGHELRMEPLTIPVGATARNLLFAHRLIDSPVGEGGPVGTPAADYVFRLADGSEHSVTIRDRFEIAALSGWGHLPFLAVTDRYDHMAPRWQGPWSEAGERQTEVYQGWPRHYFLWCWKNPSPEIAIECIEVRPLGPKFIVAGITLGLIDENPLQHSGGVPVRIELKDGDLAARNLAADDLDLRIQVDRGVAGYLHPIPSKESGAYAGWGEPPNEHASPAYANVAATPSATLAVATGADALGSVRWSDLQARRAIDTDRVRVAIVEEGRNWVQTTIVDDETGQPIPCRVHFRSPEGVPYQPDGHHSHVNSNHGTWHIDIGGDLRLGQTSYAYIDGRCQGWLPRGEVLVDVARGYEYEPLRTKVQIAPGQQRLELRLKRWTNMNRERWFSGDTHVHFLSTQGSLREGQAEDLNVVNLLQSQWGNLFTNTEDFTGEAVSSRDGRTIVWANQENRQHLLGHMILLGLKQPIYPWCSDGPDESELGGTLETTLAHWADACHAQGGTVVLPHFPYPNGEPAALVATGRVDAVEMIVHAPHMHREYYRYLNAGYRLPLVGGTDKMSSEVAVGQYRTYVRIPPEEDFSYENWCRNMQLGRTFLSGGPLLRFSVDGADIGDTLALPSSGGTVQVRAMAESILPIHTLQIVMNGAVVAQTTATSGARTLAVDERIAVDASSWLGARVGGPNYDPIKHHDTWSRGIFAHTSPIYVNCGSETRGRDELQYLLTLVEGGLQYVRHTAPHRLSGTVTHHHGEDDHLAYLERPFREALAALQARLA